MHCKFTQFRTVNSRRLHRRGLNLAALTETLKDEGAFELSLVPDGAVLVRDRDARVFVLMKYREDRYDGRRLATNRFHRVVSTYSLHFTKRIANSARGC